MEWTIALSLGALAILPIVLDCIETLRQRHAARKMRTVVEEQIHQLLAECGWYDDTRTRNEVP